MGGGVVRRPSSGGTRVIRGGGRYRGGYARGYGGRGYGSRGIRVGGRYGGRRRSYGRSYISVRPGYYKTYGYYTVSRPYGVAYIVPNRYVFLNGISVQIGQVGMFRGPVSYINQCLGYLDIVRAGGDWTPSAPLPR